MSHPKTSIIIPVCGAEKTIFHTLRALERQSRNDFEVIIVDDGNTDMSMKVVAQFSEQSNLPIKIIHQENSGPAKARNTGAEQAEGEAIIFLDSDCIPSENWVEEMTRLLNHGVSGCYCGNKARNSESIAARYVDYEMNRRHERMLGKDIDAISTYSASFLKRVFIECGGFDGQYRQASSEDFDLTFNIANKGYKMRFVDSTFVYQYHPSSWLEYLRKQFKRGYWTVKLHLKNGDRIIKGSSYFGHELQIQFALSLLALLSIPLAILHPIALLFGFGLLIASNLPFGIWAFRRERKFLFIAPVIASIRSLVGTLGAFKYVTERGFK